MKKYFLIFTFFALLLIVPIGVKAFGVKTGGSVYVAKEETITGNLFVAGSNIEIDGRVIGDVFCAGQSININGKVDGDVFCAGQSININGEIGGSVRVAGNSINMNGKTGHNFMSAGSSIILSKQATVGWEMIFAGAFTDVRGKVAGDLTGAGSGINIAGEIGKNIKLRIDQKINAKQNGTSFSSYGLNVEKDANIGGSLTYTSIQDAQIDKSAKIKGEVIHKFLAKPQENRAAFWAWGSLIWFFATLVIGLVLISLGKDQIKKIEEKMMEKIGGSVGWGAIILFLVPIAFVILCITLIGIPLALITLALWLIAVYLSNIIASIVIGSLLLKKFWTAKKDSMMLAMIFGIIIVSIISMIPVLGWAFSLFLTLWGLGGIWYFVKRS